MTETDTQIHKGLAGVVVDTTEISSVDAESNSLLYRGYPVQQLAARCSFEEVAYLLWHGELPDAAQLADLRERPSGRSGCWTTRWSTPCSRCRPPATRWTSCRTAVSVIGAHDPTAEDSSREANLAKSVRLLAQMPGDRGARPAPPPRAGPGAHRATTSASRRTSST